MSRARRIGVLGGCAAIAAVIWLLARGSLAPRGEEGAASKGAGAPERAAPVAPALAGLRPSERADDDRRAAATAAARRTIHVSGEVIASAGATLPEGYVVVRVPGEWGPSSDPVPWAADGTFRVAWTPAIEEPPAVVEVRAAALGWSLVSGRFDVKDGEARDVVLHLHGDGEFTGKVVDEAGRPLPGVLLAVGDPGSRKSPTAWPELVASAREVGGGWARTDAQGRFRIRGIPEPTRLEAIGSDPVWLLRAEPPDEDGAATTTWVAVPGFRMQAHVHLEGGGPRPTFGLELGVHGGTSGWINGSSGGVGERGWYQYVIPRSSLPSGPFRVEAGLLSDDCEPWRSGVTAEAKDGVVTFDVPVRLLDPKLRGQLSVVLPPALAEGIAITEVDVSRQMGPGSWWGSRSESDAAGARVWEMPSGRQEVKVSIPALFGAKASWTAAVDVVHGGVVVLRPVFAGFGSLRVRPPRSAEGERRLVMTISPADDPGRMRPIATFQLSPNVDLVLPAVRAQAYSLGFPDTQSLKAREVKVDGGRETIVDLGDSR